MNSVAAPIAPCRFRFNRIVLSPFRQPPF